MSTKRSAEQQVADEANRRALNPNALKQAISESQACGNFRKIISPFRRTELRESPPRKVIAK